MLSVCQYGSVHILFIFWVITQNCFIAQSVPALTIGNCSHWSPGPFYISITVGGFWILLYCLTLPVWITAISQIAWLPSRENNVRPPDLAGFCGHSLLPVGIAAGSSWLTTQEDVCWSGFPAFLARGTFLLWVTFTMYTSATRRSETEMQLSCPGRLILYLSGM